MDKHNFLILIDRYLANESSPAEIRLLEEYYERMDRKGAEISFQEPDGIGVKAAIMQSIKQEPANERNPKVSYTRLWLGAAASILVIIGIARFIIHTPNPTKNQLNIPEVACSKVITPGGNKARLTLSDGSIVDLDHIADGIVAKQAGLTIKKDRDGQLIYTVVAGNQQPKNGQIHYNSIETPMGGQYQVRLPDGTVVWLNASSSLKYPAQFTGTERKVMLSGEAYFEVSKMKGRPFKVVTDKEVVEVYGTHFNVNAYEDEKVTRTTLLEGSVKVNHGNSSVLLKPGQQCGMENGAFQIKTVKLKGIIDWKNGYFLFKEDKIYEIMRKLSRWYNIDLEYVGKLDDLNFSGKISRTKNLNEVLKVLALTGDVKFKVEGRRVTVMP
ncbi:FecR family protein [Pedobacter sp. N36a]|uniref:FecR family protein n=1 Tax=Pedobacter sp. N36a TaxID=2767996 RepID=UPI001656B071|nr:FecR family protein [Pedobacter sp. N36a]MBC8988209.1 FecR family protein [Pedobacter sp. N36a]